MTQAESLLAKLGLAGGTSLVVTESINLDPLWSGLITLAISILSVLAVDGVNWLKEWIKSKTPKNKDKEEKED